MEVRLRYCMRQRSPLRSRCKANSIARPAQRDRNTPASGFGDRVNGKVISLGSHSAQRAEVSKNESRALVRKRNDALHAGKVVKQLLGTRVGHCKIDGGVRKNLMNASDEWGKENGVSKSP